MLLTRALALSFLFAVLAPAAARADGRIIPFYGVNFGGNSGKALSDAIDAKRFDWGVSFAYMGAGVLGIEADIARRHPFVITDMLRMMSGFATTVGRDGHVTFGQNRGVYTIMGGLPGGGSGRACPTIFMAMLSGTPARCSSSGCRGASGSGSRPRSRSARPTAS